MRLGRQELDGQVLVDVPGALWTLDILDAVIAHICHDRAPLRASVGVARAKRFLGIFVQ
jgi:phage terminase large subunit-like protein